MKIALVISLCVGVLAGGAFAQSKKSEPAPKDNSKLPVIPGDKLAKIEAALPAKASVASMKPRRLLVFWRCDGFFRDLTQSRKSPKWFLLS